MENFTLESKPSDMLVEITNRCNYQCNFCTHSQMKHHFGDIDPFFLKKICSKPMIWESEESDCIQ
jgi:molybdenum cofactor biosynthesis enzyme MoaA